MNESVESFMNISITNTTNDILAFKPSISILVCAGVGISLNALIAFAIVSMERFHEPRNILWLIGVIFSNPVAIVTNIIEFVVLYGPSIGGLNPKTYIQNSTKETSFTATASTRSCDCAATMMENNRNSILFVHVIHVGTETISKLEVEAAWTLVTGVFYYFVCCCLAPSSLSF